VSITDELQGIELIGHFRLASYGTGHSRIREARYHLLEDIGTAYNDFGETSKAIAYYEQALAMVREIGSRLGEAFVLSNMSLSLYQLGERTRALANAEAALRIYEEIESPSAEKVRRKLAEWRAAPQQ
jgi:tetratricopeptide (TPR) repeat protein